MYALGMCDDLAAQIDARLPDRVVYTPDPDRHAHYQRLFSIYLSLADTLTPEFAALARAMQGENA